MKSAPEERFLLLLGRAAGGKEKNISFGELAGFSFAAMSAEEAGVKGRRGLGMLN